MLAICGRWPKLVSDVSVIAAAPGDGATLTRLSKAAWSRVGDVS